VAYRS